MCATEIASFAGSRMDTSSSRLFTHLCVVGEHAEEGGELTEDSPLPPPSSSHDGWQAS